MRLMSKVLKAASSNPRSLMDWWIFSLMPLANPMPTRAAKKREREGAHAPADTHVIRPERMVLAAALTVV
jgi:hypothetical protein